MEYTQGACRQPALLAAGTYTYHTRIWTVRVRVFLYYHAVTIPQQSVQMQEHRSPLTCTILPLVDSKYHYFSLLCKIYTWVTIVARYQIKKPT